MRTASLFLLLFVASAASAQTQTVLFPGQSGATLLASIKAAYRPASQLNYSGAQDAMIGTVDRATLNGQDGVFCVYTGRFVAFDGVPSSDPNQDVFNNGAGINTEHTWPQSLLTGDPGPRSDMHHLFPADVAVNGARANFKFDEIPDATTTTWYRSAPPFATVSSQASIPTASIDEYSELRAGTSFEPREDHEGNVARAMFYMRAVWDGQVTASFFDAAQMRALYRWHYADPITAADQARSARVATFQSGKDNPFVLDSTLIRRAFFPEIVVAGEDGPDAIAGRLTIISGNPFTASVRLRLTLATPGPVRAEAFDVLGRRVAVLLDGDAAGDVVLELRGERLAPGVYTVRVVTPAGVLTQRLVRAN